MQFRLASALAVFLGSYLPLALILWVKDINQGSWNNGVCTSFNSCVLPKLDNPFLSIAFLATTAICFLFTVLLLKKLPCPYRVNVKKVRPIPGELISYTLPYIVAFIGIDYSNLPQVLGFFIFLAWMFVISYKSGTVLMNPALSLLGWKLNEAEICVSGKLVSRVILSNQHLKEGTYDCDRVQNHYVIRRRKE